jgi:hypothetical protein
MIPWVKEYKYLGHLIHEDMAKPALRKAFFKRVEAEELKKIKDNMDIIVQCNLNSIQKLTALKWIALGRVRFLSIATPFNNKFFTQIDTLLRQSARKILKLPPGTMRDFFHIPVADGGLGIACTQQAILTQRIKFLMNTLSNPSSCRDILIASIYTEAQFNAIEVVGPGVPGHVDRFETKHRAINQITGVLFDYHIPLKYCFFGWWPQSDPVKREFYYTRNPTYTSPITLHYPYWLQFANLAAQHNIELKLPYEYDETIPQECFKFSPVNPPLGLCIKRGDMPWERMGTHASKKESLRISSKIRSIKDTMQEERFKRFADPPHCKGQQSKLWRTLDPDKKKRRIQLSAIALIIRNNFCNLGDRQITTLLKGRLRLLGNAVCKRIYNIRQSDKCPRPGCNELEWTSHIFSGCRQTEGGWIRRHNNAQDLLAAKLQETCKDIVIDKAILRAHGEKRRPDISEATLLSTDHIQVGELTFCWDTTIPEKRNLKRRKYEPEWIPTLAQTRQKQVLPELAVFVIGALGTIDMDFLDNLKKYDITGSSAKKLAIDMAIKTIRGSYSIWVSRCLAKWNRAPPRRRNA